MVFTSNEDLQNDIGLAVEDFFETTFGLARDGKTTKDGTPKNPLQLAVLLRAMQPEVYLKSPPASVQQVLFGALASLGRLLGYKTSYPRYGGGS